MRALLSVYDKTGIDQLAKALHDTGAELLSSGGTATAISAAGIPVTDVAELTGFGAMLGHRVVTLHPMVHGGILADRDDPSHRQDLTDHGIEPIDLVVVNLYPFASDPGIELIDIGGPTLVRAAAKNHTHVTVLVDPDDYGVVLDELAQHGATTTGTRRRLARKAFSHTAAYDAAIVAWFDEDTTAGAPHAAAASPAAATAAGAVTADDDHAASAAAHGPHAADPLPPTLHISLERAQELRYGENPHQAGARYRLSGTRSWWDDVLQHAGMALSYLNIFDADAAWRLVHDLGDRPAVAIIKHANPCGVAVADDLATAYQRAFECDPRSAFGGIVALNRPIDDATVAAMVDAAQADVVIAPGYDPGVVDQLVAKRKNTRLLEAPRRAAATSLAVRQLTDSYLVQQPHHFARGRDQWEVVTRRQPTPTELDDAELAWRVCGSVTSNAIVLVKGGVAWGIGAGQQNRVESGKLAAEKASGRATGGACASDAFYPFRDGVDAAAGAGAAVVIQPGGSVRDPETIAAADEHGLAMIFTGERQFRH